MVAITSKTRRLSLIAGTVFILYGIGMYRVHARAMAKAAATSLPPVTHHTPHRKKSTPSHRSPVSTLGAGSRSSTFALDRDDTVTVRVVPAPAWWSSEVGACGE
jgi:hypothetical protein